MSRNFAEFVWQRPSVVVARRGEVWTPGSAAGARTA
jgi:hypothetical protein